MRRHALTTVILLALLPACVSRCPGSGSPASAGYMGVDRSTYPHDSDGRPGFDIQRISLSKKGSYRFELKNLTPGPSDVVLHISFPGAARPQASWPDDAFVRLSMTNQRDECVLSSHAYLRDMWIISSDDEPDDLYFLFKGTSRHHAPESHVEDPIYLADEGWGSFWVAQPNSTYRLVFEVLKTDPSADAIVAAIRLEN